MVEVGSAVLPSPPGLIRLGGWGLAAGSVLGEECLCCASHSGWGAAWPSPLPESLCAPACDVRGWGVVLGAGVPEGDSPASPTPGTSKLGVIASPREHKACGVLGGAGGVLGQGGAEVEGLLGAAWG